MTILELVTSLESARVNVCQRYGLDIRLEDATENTI